MLQEEQDYYFIFNSFNNCFFCLIVPIRDDIAMAFPFLKGYLDFLVPIYDYIKGPL